MHPGHACYNRNGPPHPPHVPHPRRQFHPPPPPSQHPPFSNRMTLDFLRQPNIERLYPPTLPNPLHEHQGGGLLQQPTTIPSTSIFNSGGPPTAPKAEAMEMPPQLRMKEEMLANWETELREQNYMMELEWQQRCKASNERIKYLEDQLEVKRTNIIGLQQSLSESRAQLKHAEGAKEKAEKELEMRDSALVTLKKMSRLEKQQISAIKEENRKIAEETKLETGKLREQLWATKEQLANSNKENQTLIAGQKDRESAMIGLLEQRLRMQEQQILGLKEENQNKVGAADARELENAKLREQLRKATEQLAKSSKENDDCREQFGHRIVQLEAEKEAAKNETNSERMAKERLSAEMATCKEQFGRLIVELEKAEEATKNKMNLERAAKEELSTQLDDCRELFGQRIAELEAKLAIREGLEAAVQEKEQRIQSALEMLQGGHHRGGKGARRGEPQRGRDFDGDESAAETTSDGDASTSSSSFPQRGRDFDGDKSAAETTTTDGDASSSSSSFDGDIGFVEMVTRDWKPPFKRERQQQEEEEEQEWPVLTIDEETQRKRPSYCRQMQPLMPVKKEETAEEEEEELDQRPSASGIQTRAANNNAVERPNNDNWGMVLRERKKPANYADAPRKRKQQ